MSYNGSGTFNINSSGQPVTTGTVISSTAFNALTADLGTGLSTAITKDGQTVVTQRIPFAAGINSSLVTDSTSTTTGSVITAGGVGVAKALFVGTTLNVAGASTLAAVTGTSIAASTVLQMPDGVVGVPGLRVGSSSSTGLFSSGDNSIRVTSSGAQVGLFTGTGINNTVIGATTGAAGSFTTLSANSTLGVTGAATLSSTLGVTGATTLSSTLGVTGLTTLGVTGANFPGSSSGTATLVAPAAAGTPTLTLPTITGAVALSTRSVQTLGSGSGTYTTPAGCTAIWVRAIGGGAGGAGSGSGAGSGTAGGSTTFGAITGGGGLGGVANSGQSAAGGAVSGASNLILGIDGGRGGGGSTMPTNYGPGTMGGSGAFGGAGSGGQGSQAATAGTANSGGGGGGAGINPSSSAVSGSGGGSGAYFEMFISSPAATYSYAVGAGGAAGAAGTSSYAGGAGGSGVILVMEYY